LNGTHQLLAYADDVNLLGDNIDIIKKNTETFFNSGRVHPVACIYIYKNVTASLSASGPKS
jgi:hypothetical protein